MNKKTKDILFILILGSLCIGALLAVQAYTEPAIERFNSMTVKKTILDAAEIPYDNNDISSVYDKNIKPLKAGERTYYITPASRYIFEFDGRGLWGPISGVVTVERDLETIYNIQIISQVETPGLGARITEDWYRNQYRGKKVDPTLVLALMKKASAVNEVDTISGATITASAMVKMITESVRYFHDNIK